MASTRPHARNLRKGRYSQAGLYYFLTTSVAGRRKVRALTITIVCVFATPCFAATLVENLWDPETYPDHLNGYLTDISPPLEPDQVADDFTLAQSSLVTSIGWYGSYSGWSDWRDSEFLLSIYENSSANLPGQEIANISLASVTGVATEYGLGVPILYFEAALPSELLLVAGSYWLSIQAVLFNPGPSGWVWQHGG